MSNVYKLGKGPEHCPRKRLILYFCARPAVIKITM